MNGSTLGRIERTQLYVYKSDLDEPSKDGITALLDAAKSVHSAVTPEEKLAAMSELVSALAIHEARQAVRNPGQVQSAIEEHVTAWHNVSPIPHTAREIIVTLLQKPWPWFTLAVAVFSPHFPRILEVVQNWVH